MRIAIDATAAVSGGRIYLDHLLPIWASLGSDHEFTVFHVGDLGHEPPATGRRFQFHRAGLPQSATTHRMRGSVLKLLWRLAILPWHLHRLQPDVLFSTAGVGPAWKPAHTRVVFALHDSMPVHVELVRAEASPMRRLRLLLLRRLMQRTLRDGDAVIVFSEDLRQRLLSNFNDLKRPPYVVYHGIDWGEDERGLRPNPERLDALGIQAPYLLYVSHFHRYKNLVNMLKGFAMMHAKYPALSLVLAGEAADPVYWREVQGTIARLGLDAAVRHIGARQREDLKSVYLGAVALIYPSLAENCPFAVLEALALGLPIAAARASSLPEICEGAAIYFDPHDPAAMAEAMDRLVGDETLRHSLGRKAVARAQAFSWPRAARQTLDVLEQVVSVRGR